MSKLEADLAKSIAQLPLRIDAIEHLSKCGVEKVLHRVVVQTLFVLKWGIKRIAQTLKRSRNFVRRADAKFNHREPLRDRKRTGRPRKITAQGKKELIAVVHNRTPQRKSTRMAAKHLSGNPKWVEEDKRGDSVSPETVRRALLDAGLRYRRSKRKPKLTQV